MNQREKAVAYISGAIATYSLRKERGELTDSASMYDFLSKIIPDELSSEANIELIDDNTGSESVQKKIDLLAST